MLLHLYTGECLTCKKITKQLSNEESPISKCKDCGNRTFRQLNVVFKEDLERPHILVGNCPFCSGRKMYTINTANKTWRCHACGKGGGYDYAPINY